MNKRKGKPSGGHAAANIKPLNKEYKMAFLLVISANLQLYTRYTTDIPH